MPPVRSQFVKANDKGLMTLIKYENWQPKMLLTEQYKVISKWLSGLTYKKKWYFLWLA